MKNRSRILFTTLIWVGVISLLFSNTGLGSANTKKHRKRLETLGYLTWVPAGDTLKKKGVTRHIPGESFSGFNLYNSRDQAMAVLMDMEGGVVHRWRIAGRPGGSWQHVELCPDGDLLAIVKDRSLIRLDWNSMIKWEIPGRYHHDVALAGNRDILALSRKDMFVFRNGWPFPAVVDCVIVLSGDGKIKKEIPLYPLVRNLIPDDHFSRIYRWLADPAAQDRFRTQKKTGEIFLPHDSPCDLLHANTLEVISRDIPGFCKKGDLLVSFRQLDLIGIADRHLTTLRWFWGPGVLLKQHHPVCLDNGHILVFDNGDRRRRYSRILEIDPLDRQIEWEYRADPPSSFFSFSRGGNQRLPNGNTLITESDRGRVFEVTPAGKTVWEFYNPRIKKDNKTRAAIYRMTRIRDDDRFSIQKKRLN